MSAVWLGVVFWGGQGEVWGPDRLPMDIIMIALENLIAWTFNWEHCFFCLHYVVLCLFVSRANQGKTRAKDVH